MFVITKECLTATCVASQLRPTITRLAWYQSYLTHPIFQNAAHVQMCSVGVTDCRVAIIVCMIYDNSDQRLTAHTPTGLVSSSKIIMTSSDHVLRDAVDT
jgi:hypothetical protein